MVVAVHQTDVVVRIQQGLVVVLPVDVGQAAAGLLQLGEGDQLSVETAEVFFRRRPLAL